MILLVYLNIIANAVGSAHLEEDTIVDHRQVAVMQSRAHHCITISVGWWLQSKQSGTQFF